MHELLPFYEKARTQGDFERGIEEAVERLLVSPQFLYRIERDPANIAPATPYRISDLELASRLSFFLWSSIPDDELRNLAASGKLREPGVLDPTGEAHAGRSALPNPWSPISPRSGCSCATWKPKIPICTCSATSMKRCAAPSSGRPELFLDSILRKDRSVLELLTANYTFVNERLAKHYGIPNVQGSYFRKVTFAPDSPRAAACWARGAS